MVDQFLNWVASLPQAGVYTVLEDATSDGELLPSNYTPDGTPISV